jgi:hypothetical protein
LAQSSKSAGIFAGPQQAFKPAAEIVALAGKGRRGRFRSPWRRSEDRPNERLKVNNSNEFTNEHDVSQGAALASSGTY